jgi:hypothetical protein
MTTTSQIKTNFKEDQIMAIIKDWTNEISELGNATLEEMAKSLGSLSQWNMLIENFPGLDEIRTMVKFEVGKRQRINAQIVHDNFTRGELTEAFDKVADPEDWRNPIDIVIAQADEEITIAAVEFFVGDTPNIVRPLGHPDVIRITSVGYRAGPCGP